MHLFRDLVRRPGRPCEGGNLLEGEHAVACRIEQDQPVGLIVTAVGGAKILTLRGASRSSSKHVV